MGKGNRHEEQEEIDRDKQVNRYKQIQIDIEGGKRDRETDRKRNNQLQVG